MKRCSNCNFVVHDDYAVNCPSCGRPFPAAAPGMRQRRAAPAAPASRYSPRQATPTQAHYNPAAGARRGQAKQVRFGVNSFDHTAEYQPEEISREKPMAMLVYLLGLIGLLAGLLCRESKVLQFHVRQSAKYLVLEVAAGWILLGLHVLPGLAGSAGGFRLLRAGGIGLRIGAAVLMILTFVTVAGFAVLRISCFVQVCRGRVMEAPLVRRLRFMR